MANKSRYNYIANNYKKLQTQTSYNSFASEAFLIIGDVYPALFAMRSL